MLVVRHSVISRLSAESLVGDTMRSKHTGEWFNEMDVKNTDKNRQKVDFDLLTFELRSER